MKIQKRPTIQLLILNAFLLLIYFIIFLNFKAGINTTVMFSTSDSGCYLAVGNWIFEQKETIQTALNPFMYPLLLKFFLIIGDVYGVWLFQFFLWIVSINMVFLSIKRVSNIILAYIGAFFLSVNITYTALTLHALSDVTAVFVICWLIFYLTGNSFDFKRAKCFYILVFFFSILSVIKPIFFPVLIFCIVIIFPVFYLKSFIKDAKKYLILAALLPVIIQFSIMAAKHHEFSLSTKGKITLNQYFFAQGYASAEKISIDEARPIVKDKSFGFMLSYMFNHFKIFSNNFKDNIIIENLKGAPYILVNPPQFKHPFFYSFMNKLNKFFFRLHQIFILPCLLLLYYFAKQHSSFLKPFLVFYVLFWYLVLMMGITFWQGDRYTVSIEPLWIIIYAMVVYQLFSSSLFKSVRFNRIKNKNN